MWWNLKYKSNSGLLRKGIGLNRSILQGCKQIWNNFNNYYISFAKRSSTKQMSWHKTSFVLKTSKFCLISELLWSRVRTSFLQNQSIAKYIRAGELLHWTPALQDCTPPLDSWRAVLALFEQEQDQIALHIWIFEAEFWCCRQIHILNTWLSLRHQQSESLTGMYNSHHSLELQIHDSYFKPYFQGHT